MGAAGSVAAFFLIIDSAFFLANLTKIGEGGYVPVILAFCVYGVMWIWHRGAAAVMARMHESLTPVPEFMKEIQSKNVPRVPGTAGVLSRTERETPPGMVWQFRHNPALDEHIFMVFVEIPSGPSVGSRNRTP